MVRKVVNYFFIWGFINEIKLYKIRTSLFI